MRVADLAPDDLRRRLAGPGLAFRSGPFVTRLVTRFPDVMANLACVYAEAEVVGADRFADFGVELRAPRGVRRLFRPQAEFRLDGREPFKPLPRAQAFAFLEWGLNWCIASHVCTHLLLHAAVIARGDAVAVLPGDPGAGKSTLVAALVHRGWRLFSDELALISPADGMVWPVPRPVSLKNESIDVIRRFVPEAVLGRPCPDTSKGTVAHMRPPAGQMARWREGGQVRWFILPRWQAGAEARLEPLARSRAMLKAVEHSFNFHRMGKTGFETLVRVVGAADCHRFTYSDLDAAVAVFDAL